LRWYVERIKLSELNLYDEPALSAYVSSVGRRIVSQNGMPDLDWRFLVLDDPNDIAYCLPGGLVIISRGCLAFRNSEDELAATLAHEIGHIVARHHEEGWRDYLFLDVRTQSERQKQFRDRDQERQADEIEARLLAGAGYQPQASASFFKNWFGLLDIAGLDRFSPTEKHPSPAARFVRAERTANGNVRGSVEVEDFLQMIDGLVIGYDPKNGLLRNRRFIIDKTDLALDIPPGWRAWTEEGWLRAHSLEEDLVVGIGIMKTQHIGMLFVSRLEIARRSWRGRTVIITGWHDERFDTIGSLLVAFVKGENSTTVIWVSGFERVRTEAAIEEWLKSLRETMSGELATIRPKRLRIRQARKGGTLRQVARSLCPEDPQTTILLTGGDPLRLVKAGEWIKCIGR
jgi:predicted Zn-dependent protease